MVAVRAPRLIPPKALAVVIGGAYLIELAVRATDGSWDWGFDLPFHLSDVVALLAPVALWTRQAAARRGPVLLGADRVAAGGDHARPAPDGSRASSSSPTSRPTRGAVVAAVLFVFGLHEPIRPGAVRRASA